MTYRNHALMYYNAHVSLVMGSELPGFIAPGCGALVGQLNEQDGGDVVFIDARSGASTNLSAIGWPDDAGGGSVLDFLKAHGLI